MTLQPPDFEPMFQPGVRYRWRDGRESVVEVRDAGTLNLATGRLVACDPGWGAWESTIEPFTVTVPPGRYPMAVSITRWDQTRNPRVPPPLRRGAAAKLTVRDQPVAGWELAVQPGQDPSTWQAFAVDAGLGSFLDASAVGALSRFRDDAEWDALVDVLRGNRVANLVVEPASGLNVVVFDCGLGDGAYATWIGRTAAGEPACFVADLQLLSHSLGPLTG
jgi:hypothetical protein